MQPFYYTTMAFLYDYNEQVPVARATSRDWAKEFGVPDSEAYRAIVTTTASMMESIAAAVQTCSATSLPDSLKENAFVKALISKHATDAAAYLLFAKSVEPIVEEQGWGYYEDERSPDSKQQKQLSAKAEQSIKTTKNTFLKERYAYQALRLSYYGQQYKQAERILNTYFKKPSSSPVLDMLALSIKAGITYRFYDQRPQACYLYSKAFAEGITKHISNLQSFEWAFKPEIPESEYFDQCKNTHEAANLAAVISLTHSDPDIEGIKKVQSLDPGCPLLELLAIREIHKIEDVLINFPAVEHPTESFAPRIDFYMYREYAGKRDTSHLQDIRDLIGIYHSLAHTGGVTNRALYEIGAAYLAYLLHDYKTADEYLASAKTMPQQGAIADQWQLTTLLVTINKQPIMTTSFEAALLPSLLWIEQKAKTSFEWEKYYRDIFSVLLAPRYMLEHDQSKMILCLGRSELPPSTDTTTHYYSMESLEWVRHYFSLDEQRALYEFMTKKDHTPFEQYLVTKNVLVTNDVGDAIATTYIRRFDWQRALQWMEKLPAEYYQTSTYKTFLGANPFSTVLIDTHAPTEQDTIQYTKISYAKKMAALEETMKSSASTAIRAAATFEYGLGLYSMSYWGNSWLMDEYYWGSDEVPVLDSLSTSDYRREYYGVYTAEAIFKKVFDLSIDPNLKAASLFFAARCDQKHHIPGSGWDYGFGEGTTLSQLTDEKEKNALRQYMYNAKYFPTLVKDYSQTPFFTEAVNTCSYLRDFIKH